MLPDNDIVVQLNGLRGDRIVEPCWMFRHVHRHRNWAADHRGRSAYLVDSSDPLYLEKPRFISHMASGKSLTGLCHGPLMERANRLLVPPSPRSARVTILVKSQDRPSVPTPPFQVISFRRCEKPGPSPGFSC